MEREITVTDSDLQRFIQSLEAESKRILADMDKAIDRIKSIVDREER